MNIYWIVGGILAIGAAGSRIWQVRRGMERREFPKIPGTFKQAEDAAYSTLREHSMEEPVAKCADCGTPIEEGEQCGPCLIHVHGM